LLDLPERGQRKLGKYLPMTAMQATVRILMAEDNGINQRVGKLILQRAGFSIDLVADGNEALQAHQSNPYDVILMDCQMPVMDGFEACRHIRELEQPQPVIIAVTANALVGERDRCLNAGMDDYLSKPFQAEQLVAIVKKWVDSRAGVCVETGVGGRVEALTGAKLTKE
jgi:two-component system, sensor histidine kinase SagS